MIILRTARLSTIDNAVFGTVFTSQLSGNPTLYLPSGAQDDVGAVQPDPSELQRLPTAVHAGYVEAFAASLDTVVLAAVPLAPAAFTLTWFLRELPLRKTVETSGVEESYAMPRDDSSLTEIERALTVLASRGEPCPRPLLRRRRATRNKTGGEGGLDPPYLEGKFTSCWSSRGRRRRIW